MLGPILDQVKDCPKVHKGDHDEAHNSCKDLEVPRVFNVAKCKHHAEYKEYCDTEVVSVGHVKQYLVFAAVDEEGDPLVKALCAGGVLKAH